jgi:hypothetical protein
MNIYIYIYNTYINLYICICKYCIIVYVCVFMYTRMARMTPAKETYNII